ncbi:MAG: YheV family putative metal-binding protein [Halioglobus sp.]|nr:YheV family putative metal-binding protein [Halioglobus sp.]MBP6723450.1 YheV family putative metal-binding protein [Halioglobus sp.]
MPTSTNRRRFIAGAVCPRCALMDKIVVDLDTDQRECVACGFTEARPADPAALAPAPVVAPARELPTRVSRPAARRVETPAEPVRLIDPDRK